jgi:segregation and condensation protein A
VSEIEIAPAAQTVQEENPAAQNEAILDVTSNIPALARVYGQPFNTMPNDLYIPPEALAVMLDAFEGPLDLLLYLIRKQNLDILDIPMAALTKQYLVYVEEMRNTQFELAAEYLLMAAVLIEIKSRMLLPRPKAEEGEEVEDPRAELVRRLMEYEQMKAAALKIDAMPRVDRDFDVVQVWFEKNAAVRLPTVFPEDLKRAWATLLAQAKLSQHHLISRETVTVRDQMTKVLRRLNQGDHVEFTELFEKGASVSVVVVTFIAILEMAREQMVEIAQAEAFAPIYVRLATSQPLKLSD